MRYKTPNALEMAVKDAARRSAQDTGRAISGFYFHRPLCRVFSLPGGRFVLKGGQGMLARTIDARATHDIDLLFKERSQPGSIGEASEMAALLLDPALSGSADGKIWNPAKFEWTEPQHSETV